MAVYGRKVIYIFDMCRNIRETTVLENLSITRNAEHEHLADTTDINAGT